MIDHLTSASHRYFLAVADSRSIREASDRLRISQSAVSRQLQSLEVMLGSQLFERDSRGVVLTPAGRLLYRHLSSTMESSRRLEADLRALRGLQTGHLAISAVEGFAANGFPDVLSAFRIRHPGVTLEVRVESSAAIIEGLTRGDYDIGIAFNPRSSQVNILSEAAIPMAALMAPGHPLADQAAVTFQQLVDYPLAVPAGKGGSREIYEAAVAHCRLPVSPVLETNSAHVIQAFVQTSDGVAIAAPHPAAPYLRNGTLLAVPFREGEFAHGTLALIVDRERPQSTAGAILISMLSAAVSGMGSLSTWPFRAQL